MMTREEFNDALRSAVSNDLKQIYADIPAEEHIFSKKFERRMNRLIKSVNKYGTTPFRAFCRHAAIVVASCVFLIVATTQVKAIREPIVDFITKVYDIYKELTFEGDVSNTITCEYVPQYITEGFSLTSSSKSSARILYKYTNVNNEYIEFSQNTTQKVDIFIDTEKTTSKELNITGIEATLYKLENITYVQWIQDTYFMCITCRGEFEEAEIIKIVESVKPAE